jgi:Tfp pilus assembly protein PilW
MMTNQQGLGLPELLIALLLASFTTMALMRHYLSTKHQYHYIQTGIEQGIELQLVTDLIRDSARKAGFTPCSSVAYLATIDQRHTHQKLVAIDLTQSPNPSLQINRMSENFDTLIQLVSPTELFITNHQPLHKNQSMIVADCYHAEVHNMSQVRPLAVGQSITIAQPLAFTYHAPIYVGAWLEETYSIHRLPNNKRTLFYHRHHAEELTTAIHGLSARQETYKGRTLLQITLALDDAPQCVVETMLRTY